MMTDCLLMLGKLYCCLAISIQHWIR